MLIAMLAVLQCAAIPLMPSISTLIIHLGLAEMQMQLAVFVHV